MPTVKTPRINDSPRIKQLLDRIAENPQRASDYKEAARLLREQGQYRRAATLLRNGLKHVPDDLGLLQHLARTQHQGGFAAAAVRTWKLITRQYPDNYLAYEKLERHYVRSGQPGKAVTMYRRIAEEADFKEKSLERIVFVCKEAADVPGTLRALKKLVRRFGVTRPRARDLGRFHFKAGNWKDATSWLEKTFRLGEEDLDLRLLLALALARQGLWRKAHREIGRILEAKPDCYAGLINLCEFRLEEGELDEAEKLLDRIDRLYSNNSRARIARGELALLRGNPENAVVCLKAGIRSTAYYYRWELKRGYGLLGRALADLGRERDAEYARRLEEAISRAPDAYLALMPLAEEMISLHQFGDAERVLAELERMFPGNTRVAVARADLLLDKGYPLQAVKAIVSCIDRTPEKFAGDKVRGYQVLARAYRALGDWEQARQAGIQAERLADGA